MRDPVAECSSCGNRKIKTNTASDSTNEIAKKAAPKKYSANARSKTIHVKRGDTLRKIAKRYHVEGGWKASWKLNKKTIKNSNFRSARLGQASLAGTRDNAANLSGPSLASGRGVVLSHEQQKQLGATSVEPKPIYDQKGNIIGSDQERVFTREELDKFFAGVESGSTPPAEAAPGSSDVTPDTPGR